VRAESLKSETLAVERRGLDCWGEVLDFSLRRMSWSSRSAILRVVFGGELWCREEGCGLKGKVALDDAAIATKFTGHVMGLSSKWRVDNFFPSPFPRPSKIIYNVQPLSYK
jgi:hypothetical protein